MTVTGTAPVSTGSASWSSPTSRPTTAAASSPGSAPTSSRPSRPRDPRRAHVGPFLDDGPAPTGAWPSGPTTSGSVRSWWTTTTTCRDLCAAADVLVHTLRPAEADRRGLDFATLSAPVTESRRLRGDALRPGRALGRLPGRRPRPHGARRLHGGLRVRPGRRRDLRHPAARLPGGPGLAHGVDLRRDRRPGRAGLAIGQSGAGASSSTSRPTSARPA